MKCPYNHPTGTRCPACSSWPAEYKHVNKKDIMIKAKDLEGAAKLLQQRLDLVKLADAVARPPRRDRQDSLHRMPGEVFIRHVDKNKGLMLHSDMEGLVPDPVLYAFIDLANSTFLAALDKKAAFLGEQLEAMGVDIR